MGPYPYPAMLMYWKPASTNVRRSRQLLGRDTLLRGMEFRPFRRQPMTKSGPHASRIPSMISRTMRVRFSTFWQPYSSSHFVPKRADEAVEKVPVSHVHLDGIRPALLQPHGNLGSASAASRGSPRPSGREGLAPRAGTGISSSDNVEDEIGRTSGVGRTEGPI